MNLSIFDVLYKPKKIAKPIRLIEMFAGVGSQAMALRNIGADFEHYRVVEYDKYAVSSYNAIHGTNFSATDITETTGEELNITETDRFEYIMTYSFPCQDLSVAGKQKGMEKGTGTRSGLLWEVERLLNETEELPQILLMENVPEVISEQNVKAFNQWCSFLSKKGYKNYHQALNAKDYGIPQNRNRCFMISILGEYVYNFPRPFDNGLRLKDMLEDSVDEKYYISKEKAEKLTKSLFNQEKARIQQGEFCDTLLARDYKDPKCIYERGCKFLGNINGESFGTGYAGAVWGVEGISPTLTTMQGGGRQPHILEEVGLFDITSSENFAKGKRDWGFREEYGTLKCTPQYGIYKNTDTRIRKLTPKECWRLMGFKDEDFAKAEKVNSNSQLYKQAGNSIVVNVLEEIFKNLL